MAFLTLGLNGDWERKKSIRLEQIVTPKPTRAIQFRFDEQFMYLTNPDWEHEVRREPDPNEPGAPAYYFDDRSHREVTGPSRWRTDLASVPPELWGVFPSYGSCTMSALMHDTLCNEAAAVRGDQFWRELSEGPDSVQPPPRRVKAKISRHLRRRADQVFRISLADSGVGLANRWTMWTAVRLGGSIPLLLLALALSLLIPPLIFIESARLWISLVAIAATGALVIVVAWYSFELDWDPLNHPPSWWGAAGSMSGAVLLAAVVIPVILPVLLSTIVTRFIVWLADQVGELIATACRGFGPRTRFTVFPILKGEERPPSGGDVYENLADDGKVAVVDRNGLLRRIGPDRARLDLGTEWVLGIIVHSDAPEKLMTHYRKWIESAEVVRLNSEPRPARRDPALRFAHSRIAE